MVLILTRASARPQPARGQLQYLQQQRGYHRQLEAMRQPDGPRARVDVRSFGVLYVGPVFDRFSCQLLYLGYGTVLS